MYNRKTPVWGIGNIGYPTNISTLKQLGKENKDSVIVNLDEIIFTYSDKGNSFILLRKTNTHYFMEICLLALLENLCSNITNKKLTKITDRILEELCVDISEYPVEVYNELYDLCLQSYLENELPEKLAIKDIMIEKSRKEYNYLFLTIKPIYSNVI